MEKKTKKNFLTPLGPSRLCSATFEQLLAFGATFCGFSNLEQVLPFRAIFEQNIGLEHTSSTKKSTISWKTLHLAHSKSPPSKITLQPLSCFDITMQRGCNTLISYMVSDSENAISRASFVQVPSYRSRPVTRGVHGVRSHPPPPQIPKVRILILNIQVKECSRLN